MKRNSRAGQGKMPGAGTGPTPVSLPPPRWNAQITPTGLSVYCRPVSGLASDVLPSCWPPSQIIRSSGLKASKYSLTVAGAALDLAIATPVSRLTRSTYVNRAPCNAADYRTETRIAGRDEARPGKKSPALDVCQTRAYVMLDVTECRLPAALVIVICRRPAGRAVIALQTGLQGPSVLPCRPMADYCPTSTAGRPICLILR